LSVDPDPRERAKREERRPIRGIAPLSDPDVVRRRQAPTFDRDAQANLAASPSSTRRERSCRVNVAASGEVTPRVPGVTMSTVTRSNTRRPGSSPGRARDGPARRPAEAVESPGGGRLLP
jgi:hypothetical protein